MARPTTVGVLYPGFAAEDDYPRLERLLGARFPVVHTDIDSDTHEIGALLDMGAEARLADGARRLRPPGVDAPGVDAVMWACTSGSFVFGLTGAQAQAAAVAAVAGVPASSTSLAFVAAARALRLDTVAVVATYPDDVARSFVDFLGAAGVTVAGHRSRGIVTATEVGTLDRDAVLALVGEAAATGANALLLPDTAMHTADHLEELEALAGRPVLTANQVTVWEGLRLAGDVAPRRGAGRLFRLGAWTPAELSRSGSVLARSHRKGVGVAVPGSLEPVRRESTASIIANQLRDAIMHGSLPPGTQMAEAELASRLQVSRGPLREAMQRLVQEGLLRSESHRGLFVIRLDAGDVRDVYAARTAVERAACELILQQDRGAAAGRLDEVVDRMRLACGNDDARGVSDADYAFHEVLVAESGSPRLVRMHRTLLVETRMCMTALEGTYPVPLALVHEHAAIAGAIRSGPLEPLLRLVDEHMRDALIRLAPPGPDTDTELVPATAPPPSLPAPETPPGDRPGGGRQPPSGGRAAPSRDLPAGDRQ